MCFKGHSLYILNTIYTSRHTYIHKQEYINTDMYYDYEFLTYLYFCVLKKRRYPSVVLRQTCTPPLPPSFVNTTEGLAGAFLSYGVTKVVFGVFMAVFAT